MQGQFGLVPDDAGRVLARDLGVVLLAVGVMDILAANAPPGPALDAILWANLMVQAFEAILDTYHVATGQIALAGGIGATVFHLLLGIGFGLTLRRPKATPKGA